VPGFEKPYAQKWMMLAEDQKAPIHYHKSKMEDIINHGGGNILISVWKAAPDQSLSPDEFSIVIDGKNIRVKSGETLRLKPGESVCLVPRTYHQFWAEGGCGLTLSGEVSSVCDDLTDNYFYEKRERFPGIEEDEPSRHCLCGEYPPAP
jgi:D-lyxose ketol-isomerase